MKSKKVIVFDLDGVLLDSVSLMFSFSREKIPTITDDEIKNLHKGNIYEEDSKLNLPKIEETEEEREKRWGAYNKRKLAIPLYPGVKELVGELAKKYILAINTSAWDASTLPLLEKNGIKDSFSFIATSNINMNKVEKFKIIAEKFNKNPSELLFITDTLGDVIDAGALRIPTIVVTWGIHSREYFDEEAHKNIIAFVNTIKELENYIATNF